MLGLGGSISRIVRRISSSCFARNDVASKGKASVNNSYSTTPSAYTSVRVSMSSPDISASCCTSCRSEEHTSELQSLAYLVCRLLLEKKKTHTHSASSLLT